jgi:hypothetical protein
MQALGESVSLPDFLSSPGVTIAACICLFLVIDDIGFRDADPFAFGDANYSLYPPYSGDRGRVDVQYGILSAAQFARLTVTVDPNLTSTVSVICRSSGRTVHSLLVAVNKTAAPIAILNSRTLSFDSLSIKVDAIGEISAFSYANIRFDLASPVFFYRRLLVRISFFFVSGTFLLLFLRQSLVGSFRAVSAIVLLAISILSTDPFVLLANTEAAAVADACVRRLLLSSCKAVAAVQCLNFEWGSKTVAVFAAVFAVDLAVGLVNDSLFASSYFHDPLAWELFPWTTWDWSVVGLTLVEAVSVVAGLCFTARNSVMRALLSFFLLCLSEVAVIQTVKDSERGALALIAIAIPNLFACNYIGESQSSCRSFAVGTDSYKSIELEDIPSLVPMPN